MPCKRVFRTLSILLVSLLLLSGCGRKEAPQIASGNDTRPEIVDLDYKFEIGLVQMNFSLKGIPEGVGYQIDRTEEDPYCKCPGFWRRYIDQPPHPKLLEKPISKMIALTVAERVFFYRIRAYDNEGNIGPWSKIMRARYEDPLAD